uniref:Uncharacterized protein n=1 Tax=Bactrocera latifrons TaxID=174628 RepID=A0A0K8VT07_BACLA
MFKSISYLAFSLLLLIQLSSSSPRKSTSESEEDNTITHGTSTQVPTVGESAISEGRKRLEAFAFKGYINYLNYGLQRTNQIAKEVLADPSMYSIDSQAMENVRDILIKYVKDSDEALNDVLPTGKSERDNRFFLGMGKDYVLEQFNRTSTSYVPIEKLTPEQRVTWDTLKKHGVLEYAEEKERRSKNFVLNIVDEFEKYMKALPAAENEKKKEFSEVWDM